MRIGIDLGGTKIEIVALDENGDILHRKRVDTPQGDYRGTVAAIVALITECDTLLGMKATVGVGIPGAPSPETGLIRNANSVCLIGQPLQADIEAAIGRPIRLENDANCFAVSEAVDGAGKGYETLFGVILGTGCGGGLVVKGEVLRGRHAIAGEWGHNPLPWPTITEIPGPDCYCGQQGCLEQWISGTGIARDHLAITGQDLLAPAIVAAATAGDPIAEATLQRYEQRLARALAHVINIFDPHVIILGGGMSKVSRLYDNVPKLWEPYVFTTDHVNTPLLPPVHGDSGGVRGAAWLWPLIKRYTRHP
ncbi:MAG: ROK family protein [Gammaproteobacteria bacterium]|nr:ROK family protein [Gammaproteobacteria bacterium]